MIAAKQLDILMGVDIHLIQPPGPVPPLPIPHPFIGMVFDPVDCLPFIGAKVMVNGMPRATAGTGGKATPPHIPIGGVFVPPLPSNEGEVFMGSSTVLADGSPFSYLGLMVLSCNTFGMPPPPRAKKKKKVPKSLTLPTTVLIAIPLGMPVIVGGPPTIDLMALAMKFGLAGLKKLRKSKFMKKISDAIHNAADKIMNKLKIKSKRFRNAVHRSICFVTGHPVDVATGMVFTENIDFELPGLIPFKLERVWYSTSDYQGPLGHGWHHTYDMAMAIDDENLAVVFRMPDGRPLTAPTLSIGEQYFIRAEKFWVHRDEQGYYLRDKEYLNYRFGTKPFGNDKVYPLQAIENTTGAAIQFEYNAAGHLQRIIDSVGRVLAIETDFLGRITRIQAPHPDQADATFTALTYRYDASGNLIEVKDALQQPFTYAYKGHLLVQETNRNKLSFYFSYDGTDVNARCIRTWGDGRIYDHKLTYNLQEKWTIVENSLGVKHKHHWNDQGLVYKSVDPLGYEIFTRYDEDNQIIAEINELGYQTYYEYDEWGNQVEIRYPDGAKVQMSYDEGSLLAATDQVGGSWKWVYNRLKQLITQVDCLGNTTTYLYNELGLLKSIINPENGVTQLHYNEKNDPIELTTPDGASSYWKYDQFGRCISAIDPKKNVQGRLFNLLGWVLRIDEPDGNIRQLEYDPEGNVIKAKDKQTEVRFEYIGMGRLKARTEAGNRVEFKYDTEENLLGIINEHGYAYRFELDSNGQVILESGFDGVTRKYKRDAAGRVVEVERPHGLNTRYSYDPLNRIMEMQHSGGYREQFCYRPDGELVEANNNYIKVKFERDKLGRVLKETQGSFIIESRYDKLGRRIGLSSSLGAQLAFGRNIMGDVESVQSLGANQPWNADFKRDVLGLELERQLPGGVHSVWKRDQLGRPTEHKTVTGGGRLIRLRQYTWDINDRLKQINDPQKGSWKFEHDVLGNLSAAQYPDGSSEYRMPDAVGNLFRSRDRKDCKYGPAGQLLEANGTRYEYDAEGNLIQKTEAKGVVWRYEWNAAGMLRKVIRPDGEIVSFTYDALGRRIAKQYRNRTTRWVWDGNVMLHEWVEYAKEQPRSGISILPSSDHKIKIRKRDELIVSEPSHGPPQGESLTAERPIEIPEELTTWVFEAESFAPIAKFKGSEQYSIVSDHLGTPMGMYNNAGAKVWDMELSIYGAVQQVEGWRETCPFRYPGQYEDEETGLYYNRFRYYDVEQGQYISQDPIRLSGGGNFYAYVNDTNIFCDVFGLSCSSESGKRGVTKAKHDLKLNGYTIVGEEVRMKIQVGKSKISIRADIVAKDKNGKLHVFEVKNNTGKLTKNQDKTGLFNMEGRANSSKKGGGTIDTSGGTKSSFEVDTSRQPKVGNKGDTTKTATFNVLHYSD